jgi:hypothetical protein
VPEFYVVYRDHDLTLQVADNVPLALAQVMLKKLKEFVGATGLVTQNLLYRVEQQLIGFLLQRGRIAGMVDVQGSQLHHGMALPSLPVRQRA